MSYTEKTCESSAVNPKNQAVSQAIFVVAALAIITGGLWSLYMADAPYHPHDVVSQNHIVSQNLIVFDN